MNSFIKNFFAILVFSLAFFSFSVVSKADACEIADVKTRPPSYPAPGLTYPLYTQDNPPYFYLDVKTINCTTGTSPNQMIIRVMDNDLSSNEIMEPSLVHIIRVAITPPTTVQMPPQSEWYQTDQDDFTIPIRMGEIGSQNECKGASIEWGQLFIATTPVGIVMGPTSVYESWQYIFSESIPECMLYFEINIQGGNSVSIGGLENPAVTYKCDGSCNLPFISTTGSETASYCPIGQNPLTYGSICNNDTGTQTVIIPGSGAGSASSGAGEYSTAPLAPLPGFTGNPNVGQWLESLFTILIVIAGLLALIMIIVGGITYITSESFGEKGKGRSYIMNAIAGLVLALGAWVILNTINPDLAEDLNIKIPTVSLEGDTNIFTNTFTNGTTAFVIPPDLQSSLGLQCPESGGFAAVPSIIDSFVNKTTYRFGGKGGHLPQGQSFTTSNGNSSMCVNDSGGQQQCGSFCPSGSICLDCSGFVNHVRRCAGLPTYGGTFSMVSSPNAVPVDMSTLSSNGQSLTAEGATYELQPGDILVWNGHVVIYYGDGQIAESQGSTSGLIKNSNIKKSSLAQSSYKNRITHLIKVNP